MTPTDAQTYALGFAAFLAGLLPDSWTVVELPAPTGSSRARMLVANLVGEQMVVHVEHIGAPA